jgi:hypothetical protein
MSINKDYKIKNVKITTNGRNEIYFDIEWDGDNKLDYYELRIWESDKDNCLEVCAYASHKQKITVKDFYFMKNWKSKAVNKETFYVELGIADYSETDELNSWKVLAAYEPINVDLYYEHHIFKKNVLEIR